MSTGYDALQQMFELPLNGTIYGPNSRYAGIEITQLSEDDEHVIVYLRRRFIPQAATIGVTGYHRVAAHERVDVLADKFLGNSELYWRLCDANEVMQPEELEVVNDVIKIPPPIGLTS